jgi:hypothetical protein
LQAKVEAIAQFIRSTSYVLYVHPTDAMVKHTAKTPEYYLNYNLVPVYLQRHFHMHAFIQKVIKRVVIIIVWDCYYHNSVTISVGYISLIIALCVRCKLLLFM